MEKKKNGFASGLGFVLAAAGSAVGLGNLWAFPYKTSANGGAAFVLIYIACVLFIGVVAMLTEIFIGKRAEANPVTAYKKIAKGLGCFGVVSILIPFFIATYYSVLGGYTVKYAMNSFAGNAGIFESFAGNVGEVILYTAIFLSLALIIIVGGVKGGIEKASKVLMPALFIILLFVVVFSLTLGEGVADGLTYYLNPDFSVVTFSSVLAAMGQAFYSLSIGMGALITYGSYTGKKVNILRSTAMICLFDTLVALLAGLAIFPALFHYIATTGADPNSLGMGGVGLMFSTLPLVFDAMGSIGQIVSFFFFAMVAVAAVTSVISLLEVVTQFVIQKFRTNRKKSIAIVAGLCFVISVPIGISLGSVLNGGNVMVVLGQDLLDLFDIITNTVLMPVCALFACVAVGWIIGADKAVDEIEAEGTPLGWFRGVYRVMVKYITPIMIAVIEVFGIIDLVIPKKEGVRSFSSDGLGIVITSYALLLISIIVYFIFFKNTETGCNQDEMELPAELDD